MEDDEERERDRHCAITEQSIFNFIDVSIYKSKQKSSEEHDSSTKDEIKDAIHVTLKIVFVSVRLRIETEFARLNKAKKIDKSVKAEILKKFQAHIDEIIEALAADFSHSFRSKVFAIIQATEITPKMAKQIALLQRNIHQFCIIQLRLIHLMTKKIFDPRTLETDLLVIKKKPANYFALRINLSLSRISGF